MNQDEIKNTNEKEKVEETEIKTDASEIADKETCNLELDSLKNQLDEKNKQCAEYIDKLQRTAAEFDNYKKRTAKEKEALYSEAQGDAISEFLPVVDNMERALEACGKEGDVQSLREGVEMIYKQLKEIMKNLGVEEIKSRGEKFNPNLHNAVMHIDDDSYGESEIIDEFQKGYKMKDKVLRYSMVKVAN